MRRPNIAQHVTTLLALLPALVLAIACGAATPTHSPAPASTPTPTSLPTATPSPLVSLPQDEAPHDEPVEWWYFNGLLTDGAGNEYSYHFVAFKGQGPANAVPHLMHVSLGDHHRREHFAAETPTLSPVAENAVGVDVEAGGWTMRGDGAAYQLRFSLGGRTIEIEAVPQREPVLHGGTGLISLGPVGDTYYYSRTRLETAGYIEDQSGRRTVSGTSWMDHQWGAVSGRAVGWDWLSLHLDNGADLMAVVVRDPGARQLFANYGTYVGPGGEVSHLDGEDVSITPTGSWTSPATGITYPMGWKLEIPPLDLSIEATPVLEQAEFAVSEFIAAAYWEGAVKASGTLAGSPITGAGFMELVGYDPEQLEAPEPPPARE